MSETAFIALAVIGGIYLAGWPIRIAYMRKHNIVVGPFPSLLPGFGGAVLIFADIMVLVRFDIAWAYSTIVIHSAFFIIGAIKAANYLKSVKTK